MQSDNNQEMFPIVDEQGTITGAATRGECHSGSKLLHPVVHLHVFHLLKGGAIALDDLHQAARAVLLLPENQHLQRVGRVSLRKDDIFLHAVAVQINHQRRTNFFRRPEQVFDFFQRVFKSGRQQTLLQYISENGTI